MPLDDESLQRIAALERQVTRLDEELAAARLRLQRVSVQQALMDERLLTLERNRLFRLWGKIYRGAASVYARIGAGKRYGGVSDLRTPGDYAHWVEREQRELAAEDHRGSAAAWRSRPLISVQVTDGAGAVESVQSVFAQCYANWELCVSAQLRSTLKTEMQTRAVEKPGGEFVLLLQAGDRLSTHALHFYAQALQDEPVDALYADEDSIGSDGSRSDPLFKPGWSPLLLESAMYLGRAIVNRGTVFRLPVAPSRVKHISRVLYHRATPHAPLERNAVTYTAPPDSRLSVIICSRQVQQIRECLVAMRKTAKLRNELLVVHHLESGDGGEMRQFVEQAGGKWIPYRGPFDFARMNNIAAGQATAPYLLFLNDDVIAGKPAWDEAMAATLARPEIGVAGAILEYPNGTIQHAGVVTGMGDAAGHCGRFQMASELWPWLRMSREVSAVTGAMLGIRADLFRELQSFDERFPVNYNDVDLCLRVRAAGLSVVCLDLGKIVHKESQTRVGGTRHEEREALYKRWAHVLAQPDEFYSRHLAPVERIALRSGRPPLQELMG